MLCYFCWDRQPVFAYLNFHNKTPLSVPLLRTPVLVGHIRPNLLVSRAWDTVSSICGSLPSRFFRRRGARVGHIENHDIGAVCNIRGQICDKHPFKFGTRRGAGASVRARRCRVYVISEPEHQINA